MSTVLHALRRALIGTGSTAFTLIGAVVIGFGVPLFWIYVASQLYGKPGAVTGPVALFIGTGILVSYWGLLLVASWLRARIGVGEQDAQQYRRAAWNRSMRDSRYRPGHSRSDPIERLFVATAIVSIIGFAIWFAFFAGAPFPSNPG
jgi:multisubunit Na+/H+ antiporter MnhC subunit